MQKNILFAIFIFGLTTLSCRKKEEDQIMLSAHDVTFNANGDSVWITSKAGWWFADLILDSTHYVFNLPRPGNNCKLVYSDSSFQLERRSCDSLFVKMSPNKTNAIRHLWIQVEFGDYFSSVLFTQNKK